MFFWRFPGILGGPRGSKSDLSHWNPRASLDNFERLKIELIVIYLRFTCQRLHLETKEDMSKRWYLMELFSRRNYPNSHKTTRKRFRNRLHTKHICRGKYLYACITMDDKPASATWRDEQAGCMAAACETFMTAKKGKRCYDNLRNVRVLHSSPFFLEKYLQNISSLI